MRSQRRAQQHPVAPRATDAKKRWGEGSGPSSEALPAEIGENSLQIWHAAQAALDGAARRDNSARIFARRKTGVRRTSSMVWHGSRQGHQRPVAPRATGGNQMWGEGGWPGGEALPAEDRGRGFVKLAPGAGSFERRCAEQRCGPHLCTPPKPEQDARATLCDKRTAISQRRAQQRPATPRVTDAKKKAQGEGGRPGNDALPAETRGNHVRCLARAVGSCGRRGAAQQRGPHLCAPQDRSEKREQRYVAWRTAISQSVAQ